jgi:two-component system cell cycle response regulator
MSAKRILIIDDTPEFILMMRFRLEANGYEVVEAHTGPDGLTMAETHGPGLVLLDVVMPDMDGFEVLAKIKATPATAHIPVVMLSAKADQAVKDRASELAASAFVTKPCDSAKLLSTISEHFVADLAGCPA